MNNLQRTVNNGSVLYDTDYMKHLGKEAVKNAARWQIDPDKKLRQKASECRTCYYLRRGRVGGAAMTSFPCGLCGEVQLAGSTNTDRLCLKCGLEHQLCVYCGADVELRSRRTVDLPPAKVMIPCAFCADFFPKDQVSIHMRAWYCGPCKDANPILTD